MQAGVKITRTRNEVEDNDFFIWSSRRGELCLPLYLTSLEQVLDFLGNPPENSEGIRYAVQALLYNHALIYFRVGEEGFSTEDYIHGLKFLKQRSLQTNLTAIGMPGVGDEELIKRPFRSATCIKASSSFPRRTSMTI